MLPTVTTCQESPPVRRAPPSPGAARWRPGAGHLAAAACWAVGCVVAAYVAMRSDFEPGRLGPRLTRWPAGTAVTPSPGRVTVLAFLHPRCVCTAATVKHLTDLLPRHPDSRLVAVVFVPPGSGPGSEWAQGDYARALRATVPGARVVADPGGAEAERFGASTSGTILVYDRQGNEVFRGGITDRRGGDGDNRGLRRLNRALSREALDQPDNASPVFGCALQCEITRSRELADQPGSP